MIFSNQKSLACCNAIQRNDKESLLSLLQQGYPCDTWAYYYAVDQNNLEIIEVLMKFKIPWDYKAINRCVVNDNLELLKHFQKFKNCYDHNTFALAAQEGSLAMVTYLFETSCPHDEWTFYSAVKNNRLEIVDYFLEKGFDYNKTLCDLIDKKITENKDKTMKDYNQVLEKLLGLKLSYNQQDQEDSRRIAENKIKEVFNKEGPFKVSLFQNYAMVQYDEEIGGHFDAPEVRGIVVDYVDKYIVASSPGYTPFAVTMDLQDQMKIRDQNNVVHSFNLKEVEITKAYSCSVIRVVKVQDKIKCFPHTNLDENKSRMPGGKLFKDMFLQSGVVLEDLFPKEVKVSRFSHIFLIIHPDLTVNNQENVKTPFALYLSSYETVLPENLRDNNDRLLAFNFPEEPDEKEGNLRVYVPKILSPEKAKELFKPKVMWASGQSLHIRYKINGRFQNLVLHHPNYHRILHIRQSDAASLLNYNYQFHFLLSELKRQKGVFISFKDIPKEEVLAIWEKEKSFLNLELVPQEYYVKPFVENRKLFERLIWLNLLAISPEHLIPKILKLPEQVEENYNNTLTKLILTIKEREEYYKENGKPLPLPEDCDKTMRYFLNSVPMIAKRDKRKLEEVVTASLEQTCPKIFYSLSKKILRR